MNFFVLFQGKSTTTDPSGVAQGIPAAVDEDSIASLEEEEEHIPSAIPTPTPTPSFHPSAPMDHDEEMFKGNGLVKKYRGGWERWAEAFENMVVRKHTTHFFYLAQN